MALIGIRVEGKKILQVAEEIAKLDEVDYLIITSGRFDIFAEVICRDRDELFAFLSEKLYQIDGVRELELLANKIWQGKGVLGPEAFDPDPFLERMPAYDFPYQIVELDEESVKQLG